MAALVEPCALRSRENDDSKSRKEIHALAIRRELRAEVRELSSRSNVQLRLQHLRIGGGTQPVMASECGDELGEIRNGGVHRPGDAHLRSLIVGNRFAFVIEAVR